MAGMSHMTSDARAGDPIRHVVLLILENRSFDQMLGCFRAVYPNLDGIDPAAPGRNDDGAGNSYFQAPTDVRQMEEWDPRHEVEHVAAQLADHNSGFVKDFVTAYSASTLRARQLIMSYYPLDFLPALHRLARTFTICDRWFSSLPGPTWPNRFFSLTGTSSGRVDMPDDGTHRADVPGYFEQNQLTLFDRLNDRAVHWKVYFHDIPQTTVLARQRVPHNVARYFYIDKFFDDARSHEAEFPQFCLIEPDFQGWGENDDHPPHDIMRAEKLIADVYNAVRSNEALWSSTLLIVMFDEHGGYFDHVEPPAAIPPDDASANYPFTRLGVRVPALLVSPWVDARVESSQFDHTSVLKYLTDKWQLGPLGRRTAAATSIAVAINRTEPRSDTIARIELTPDELKPPDRELEEETFGAPSTHQTALRILAAYLKVDAVEGIPRLAVSAARLLQSVRTALQLFIDRLLKTSTVFKISIAEPDKLTSSPDATARDDVARFLIRTKRYAADGLHDRLQDSSLTTEQQQHTLHTLTLITGLDFHHGDDPKKVISAIDWLAKSKK